MAPATRQNVSSTKRKRESEKLSPSKSLQRLNKDKKKLPKESLCTEKGSGKKKNRSNDEASSHEATVELDNKVEKLSPSKSLQHVKKDKKKGSDKSICIGKESEKRKSRGNGDVSSHEGTALDNNVVNLSPCKSLQHVKKGKKKGSNKSICTGKESEKKEKKAISDGSSQEGSVELNNNAGTSNSLEHPAKRKGAVQDGEASERKRQKCPGVRVIHGRIYDSENGHTCHQCRQKTIEIMAHCNNPKGAKPCNRYFCPRCLLNRYGEKVEDVSSLEVWPCPSCRGICNCSVCMKKKGCPPTGMLSPSIKSTGFSSVADYLGKKTKEQNANSPGKQLNADGRVGELKVKQGKKKGNKTKDAKQDGSVGTSGKKANGKQSLQDTVPSSVEETKLQIDTKKRKKGDVLKVEVKQSNCKEKKAKMDPESVSDAGMEELMQQSPAKCKKEAKGKKGGSKDNSKIKNKDRQTCDPTLNAFEHNQKENQAISGSGPEVGPKKQRRKKMPLAENVQVDVVPNSTIDEAEANLKSQPVSKLRKPKVLEADISLPQGQELLSVAGIELPKAVIGPALQFIEFCSAFERLLAIKKGQAEAILRELVRSNLTMRRGAQSQFAQLHVRLLSVLEDDAGNKCEITFIGKNSWFEILKRHLRERSCVFSSGKSVNDECLGTDASNNGCPDMPEAKYASTLSHEERTTFLTALNKGVEGYSNLEMEKKLQLLNILCDDCLCTKIFRDYMDDAIVEHGGKQKETREEITAAKKEFKEAAQRKKDAMAKHLLALGNEGPVTLNQQAAIVSKIQAEAEKATATKMALVEAASKMQLQRCDALRTERIIASKDGQTFWRLRGASERSVIVLQDISNLEPDYFTEAWSTYSKEQESLLAKYIRIQKIHKRGNGPLSPVTTNNTNLEPQPGSPLRNSEGL